jgi:hypothetical protein
METVGRIGGIQVLLLHLQAPIEFKIQIMRSSMSGMGNFFR